MYFNSFVYVFAFLPIVFILYSIFRTSIVGKWILFVASCIFYGWYHAWYLLPMFFSAGLDYMIARRIDASTDQVKRRRFLMVSITANLGLMAVFKYTG